MVNTCLCCVYRASADHQYQQQLKSLAAEYDSRLAEAAAAAAGGCLRAPWEPLGPNNNSPADVSNIVVNVFNPLYMSAVQLT